MELEINTALCFAPNLCTNIINVVSRELWRVLVYYKQEEDRPLIVHSSSWPKVRTDSCIIRCQPCYSSLPDGSCQTCESPSLKNTALSSGGMEKLVWFGSFVWMISGRLLGKQLSARHLLSAGKRWSGLHRFAWAAERWMVPHGGRGLEFITLIHSNEFILMRICWTVDFSVLFRRNAV